MIVIVLLGYFYIKAQKNSLNTKKELIFYKIEFLSSNFLEEILKEYNKKKPEIIKAHEFLLKNLDKDINQIKQKLGKNFHIFITDKNFTITKTTFKYDQNFSLAFVKDLLISHKQINVSPPICEPATTNFISFSDVYKNGIVTQIGYIYTNPKIEYFKNEIKKIKLKNPFIKNISLYFIHPNYNYAQICNILTPLHRKYTTSEMEYYRKKGLMLYKKLLKQNPIITNESMYILSFNPFEKESFVILKLDINESILDQEIKKTTKIILLIFGIIIFIGFLIHLFIDKILKSLEEFTNSIKLEKKYEKKPIKELQETINAYNNTLEKLKNAISSKDDFIHFAMHEFATPINILSLYMDEYEELRPAIKKLLSSYKNMNYYIHNTNLPKSEFDLKEVIINRVKYFKEILNQENKKILLNLKSKKICANLEEIEILIDNNLKNAIKYSKSETIKISLKNNILEFENEGVIKDKDKVFEKFYREENVKGGFGLGLYIIKSITEKYKIKINLIQKNNKVIFQYDLKDMDENCGS